MIFLHDNLKSAFLPPSKRIESNFNALYKNLLLKLNSLSLSENFFKTMQGLGVKEMPM